MKRAVVQKDKNENICYEINDNCHQDQFSECVKRAVFFFYEKLLHGGEIIKECMKIYGLMESSLLMEI